MSVAKIRRSGTTATSNSSPFASVGVVKCVFNRSVNRPRSEMIGFRKALSRLGAISSNHARTVSGVGQITATLAGPGSAPILEAMNSANCARSS